MLSKKKGTNIKKRRRTKHAATKAYEGPYHLHESFLRLCRRRLSRPSVVFIILVIYVTRSLCKTALYGCSRSYCYRSVFFVQSKLTLFLLCKSFTVPFQTHINRHYMFSCLAKKRTHIKTKEARQRLPGLLIISCLL